MNWFYTNFVAGNQKALVGFAAAAVAAYLAKHGVSLEMTLGDVLNAALYGLLGLFGVYFKVNR